ncbi:MAG: hypothetical protein U5J99_02720 [Parvularculaceae bacterium]|nr:hypothetical protein [Parvularculaceae bacterium]
MKATIVALAAVSAFFGHAAANDETAPRTYEAALAAAQSAFAAEDFPAAAAALDEAQAFRPYSLFLTRNRILAHYRSGETAAALAIAEEVAARGIALEFPATEAFNGFLADGSFAPVLQSFNENLRPKGSVKIAAAFAETALLPEAVVKTETSFLIGSVRSGKILEASPEALSAIATLDGGVFDLALSSDHKRIHAVVNNQLAYEGAGIRAAEAAFVTMDRRSGAIISKTVVSDGAALLGDIEADGDSLYASDSLTPRVLLLGAGKSLQTLAADPLFVNLQGLALDHKKRRLYVADHLAGLFVVDLKSNSVTPIANPGGAHLGGIDGLYLYKGDLIGIQNGTTPQRIVRIDLDRKGLTARKLSVLQQALPEWSEPTHGFIEGDRLIYIATSNWPAYDDAGKPREGAVLKPLRLMSVDLN